MWTSTRICCGRRCAGGNFRAGSSFAAREARDGDGRAVASSCSRRRLGSRPISGPYSASITAIRTLPTITVRMYAGIQPSPKPKQEARSHRAVGPCPEERGPHGQHCKQCPEASEERHHLLAERFLGKGNLLQGQLSSPPCRSRCHDGSFSVCPLGSAHDSLASAAAALRATKYATEPPTTLSST